MKKGFSVFLALFFLFPVFSTSIPEQLLGIWEGKDRYVFFEQQPENENPDFFNNFTPKNYPQLVIILKEYYGWYLDRAAEPEAFAQKEIRTRNAATHKTAEYINFDIRKYNPTTSFDIENKSGKTTKTELNDNDDSFELVIEYSHHHKNYIPVAIIENQLYTDFYKKVPQQEKQEFEDISFNGYWLGNLETNGITINPQIIDTNIGLLVIDGQKMYDIRYWLSDIEERDERDMAVDFIYGEDKYTVPKYLFAANNQYSCVNGRSKKIRNAQNYTLFNEADYCYNNTKTIMAKNDSCYLRKLADKDDFEALMKIVQAANSRRKPDPPPLFPPSNLDWHWDLIDLLEKDNEQIQKVRKRQRAFGLRGKELNPPR